ncbi:MAG TPA: hypothetical protein PLJ42_01560 [Chitinophagales bacterium]|jgi:hypothetical protein|nr:hypothetical protein [Chitinophagales bacterium]HQW78091.1 hypothetical protein [Chitinophagales bacterium]HRB68275.1 hypothetical protein [Chitinophagales bacterium]HRB92746.1 hypothetical protein [Chitinophagales bacterium]
MNTKMLLAWVYEIIWFIIALVLGYALIMPIKHEISHEFYKYLFASVIFIVIYFHFVAFMSRSILMESIWSKIIVFILNVPLFFYLINKYYEFGKVYDEYNFTLPSTVFQHIKSGTELEDLVYIKNLVTFVGIASITLLFLLQIRIVIAIFKLRQLDKVLYKNKNQ